MKDSDKLIVSTVVTTAFFVSPWALFCAAAGYYTWKSCERRDARKRAERGETDSNIHTDSPKRHEFRTPSSTDSTESPTRQGNAPTDTVVLTQDEIDTLLSPE